MELLEERDRSLRKVPGGEKTPGRIDLSVGRLGRGEKFQGIGKALGYVVKEENKFMTMIRDMGAPIPQIQRMAHKAEGRGLSINPFLEVLEVEKPGCDGVAVEDPPFQCVHRLPPKM